MSACVLAMTLGLVDGFMHTYANKTCVSQAYAGRTFSRPVTTSPATTSLPNTQVLTLMLVLADDSLHIHNYHNASHSSFQLVLGA